MPSSSIGNMSQVFISQRHNLDLRTRLNTLTSEFSSGRKDDLARSIGADTARLTNIDRRVAVLDSYMLASSETAQELEIVQQSLARVDSVRAKTAEALLNSDFVESDLHRQNMSNTAKDAFKEMVTVLNTRFADRSIFSGAAAGQSALASPTDMIASIEAAVAGLSTVADVEAAVDLWFDDPAGGFATMGYTGDDGDPVERRIDEGQSISLTARADADQIKNVLKGAALGFAASAASLSGHDHAEALRISGVSLIASAEPFVNFRSQIGASQERIQETRAMQVAEQTTLSRIYNDLVLTDQFETGLALQEVQTQLETHYTITARLSRLSLAEYL